MLTKTEIEEIGFSNAIKQGRIGEFVDTEKFLKKLRK